MTIPQVHRSALLQLLALSESDAAAFVRAIKDAPPTLLLGTIARRLAAVVALPVEELVTILIMLASMYLTRQPDTQSRDGFAEAVVSSAREMTEFKDAAIDWSRAQKLLSDLLACDRSLGVTAKAGGVMSEFEKTFASARILTDMRPIFGDSVAEPPAAAVIVHTLRIRYHASQGGDETAAVHVAVDSEGLRELGDQIKRALAKEQSITKALAGIPLPVLSSQKEEA
ncbi:MAG TPA: hypothetical protein VFK02_11570 [Kofleriaceae bacterium]|nr:hypothetical protein [Kofleriaceae bacterium]